MMLWDVYSEGYAATGEHGVAQLVQSGIEAPTFEAACDIAYADAPRAYYDPNATPRRYWACQLFPTLEEAQRAYG